MALCALAFVFGCQEPEVTPDKPDGPDGPTGKGEFTLTSDAAVTIDQAGGEVKVEFTSTVDWAASLDVESSVATLNVKSGSAEDTFVKVTVKAFEEKNSSREIKLTLKPEGLDNVVVTITQNGEFVPFFEVSESQLEIGAAGGQVSFTISTNTEFNVKTYDEFEEWAAFTLNETTGTFTVQANPEFDAREAYVKFTVPAIQVPILDDEGKETGETEDMPVRVYLSQKGKVSLDWIFTIPDDIVAGSTNYSVAIYNSALLLCNGSALFMVNTVDGTVLGEVPMETDGHTIKCITTDDAGNLLILLDGMYTEGMYVIVMPSSNQNQQKTLLYYPNPYYGYGLNNIKAKGDVYGQAVVTTFGGGAPNYGGKNVCLYWNVGSGSAAWEKNGEDVYISKPTGDIAPEHLATHTCWDSFRCIFAPVGPRVSDGFMFGGYDGQYKLLFHDGSSWSPVMDPGYTWESGITSYASIDWGGEVYSIALGMSYFPCWAIASDLWFMKGNGASVETAAKIPVPILTTEGLDADSSIYAYTPQASDVALHVEDGNLAAYIIDGSLKVFGKVTFSK